MWAARQLNNGKSRGSSLEGFLSGAYEKALETSRKLRKGLGPRSLEM
jgi:hypothetical protein